MTTFLLPNLLAPDRTRTMVVKIKVDLGDCNLDKDLEGNSENYQVSSDKDLCILG